MWLKSYGWCLKKVPSHFFLGKSSHRLRLGQIMSSQDKTQQSKLSLKWFFIYQVKFHVI